MEITMYNKLDLQQRLIIIKSAGLEDATILDKNYRSLIRQAASIDEQEQLNILHINTQKRIEELSA